MLSEEQIRKAYDEALKISEAHEKKYRQTGLPTTQALYWWTRAKLLYWILGGGNEVSSEFMAACEGVIHQMSKSGRLDQLEKSVRSCELCPLHKNRVNANLGAGSPWSPLFVVTGAPTDNTGSIYSPNSSFIFEWMREITGYSIDHVYVTNIVKCPPRPGRTPATENISVCWSNIESQLAIVDPKVVLAIGSIAARRLTRSLGSRSVYKHAVVRYIG